MPVITEEMLGVHLIKPEEKVPHAKTALEQKYGMEFEITEVYPQKFGELYYNVQAYAKEDPLLRFSASIDTEDDGCADTLVERRVCRNIAGKAARNLDDLEGYYDVVVHARGPQPITADTGLSIADYAALDPANEFRAEVFVMPEGVDAAGLYRSLTRLFAGLEYLKADARLYLVNEDQMAAVQGFMEEHDALKGHYQHLTKPFFRVDLPYNAGVIGLSENDFAAKVRTVL